MFKLNEQLYETKVLSNCSSPVIQAVVSNDLVSIKQLIQNPITLSSCEENLSLPLLNIAAYCGHLEMAQYLVTQGASIFKKNYFDATLLFGAPFPGHIFGVTPLAAAAFAGHIKVVDWLLTEEKALGVESNEQEEQGTLDDGNNEDVEYLPIVFATFRGHLEIIKLLINRWANKIDEKMQHIGFKLLLTAAGVGHLKTVQWLVKEGRVPVVDIKNEAEGTSPLLVAAHTGHLEIVQWLLIEGGASLSQKDEEGRTALLVAAHTGHLEIVQWLLIEGGASLSQKDEEGRTALLVAAHTGHLEIVQWLLIEGGASLSQKDKEGRTALLVAADENNLAIVKWLLLEGGASIADTQDGGKTVWWYAFKKAKEARSPNLLLWLLQKYGNQIAVSQLQDVYDSSSFTMREELHHVSKFYNLPLDMESWARVVFAQDFNRTMDARMRLIGSLPVNFPMQLGLMIWGYVTESPISAYKQDWICLDVLVRGALVRGAVEAPAYNCHKIICVDKVYENGRTDLHFACLRRDMESIRLLVEARASIFVQDKDGYTPLDYLLFDQEKAANILDDKMLIYTGQWVDLISDRFDPEFDICPILSLLVPGRDPQELLSQLKFFRAAELGDLEAVRAYIKANKGNAAALNATHLEGSSALIMATYFKQAAIVKELLKEPEIDVNIQNKSFCTALSYAQSAQKQAPAAENIASIELLTTAKKNRIFYTVRDYLSNATLANLAATSRAGTIMFQPMRAQERQIPEQSQPRLSCAQGI